MLFVPYWKEVDLCIEKFLTSAQLQCTVRYFREKKKSCAECSHDLKQSVYVSIIWYQS